MSDEPVYILYDTFFHYRLREDEDAKRLTEALAAVAKPGEVVVESLRHLYHKDRRIEWIVPPNFLSVVFIDLSASPEYVPERIKEARRALPCAAFVLFGTDEEYRACLDALPDEVSDPLKHYFVLWKSSSDLQCEVRKAIDDVHCKKHTRAGIHRCYQIVVELISRTTAYPRPLQLSIGHSQIQTLP